MQVLPLPQAVTADGGVRFDALRSVSGGEGSTIQLLVKKEKNP